MQRNAWTSNGSLSHIGHTANMLGIMPATRQTEKASVAARYGPAPLFGYGPNCESRMRLTRSCFFPPTTNSRLRQISFSCFNVIAANASPVYTTLPYCCCDSDPGTSALPGTGRAAGEGAPAMPRRKSGAAKPAGVRTMPDGVQVVFGLSLFADGLHLGQSYYGLVHAL